MSKFDYNAWKLIIKALFYFLNETVFAQLWKRHSVENGTLRFVERGRSAAAPRVRGIVDTGSATHLPGSRTKKLGLRLLLSARQEQILRSRDSQAVLPTAGLQKAMLPRLSGRLLRPSRAAVSARRLLQFSNQLFSTMLIFF